MRKFAMLLALSLAALIAASVSQDRSLAAGAIQYVSPSGEASVGQPTIEVSATPTISTSPAYAANDCLGSLMTFLNVVPAGSSSFTVTKAMLRDADGTSAPIDLIFFWANPTSSTFTDNAACTINAADATKVAGAMHLTDCTAAGTSVCRNSDPPLDIALAAGTSTLYAQAVERGTPTYTGTSKVSVALIIKQDP